MITRCDMPTALVGVAVVVLLLPGMYNTISHVIMIFSSRLYTHKMSLHKGNLQRSCNTISESTYCLRNETFDGFEYVFSDPQHNYTYTDAKRTCSMLNAHLASVTSEDEHDFLVSQMTESVFGDSMRIIR